MRQSNVLVDREIAMLLRFVLLALCISSVVSVPGVAGRYGFGDTGFYIVFHKLRNQEQALHLQLRLERVVNTATVVTDADGYFLVAVSYPNGDLRNGLETIRSVGERGVDVSTAYLTKGHEFRRVVRLSRDQARRERDQQETQDQFLDELLRKDGVAGRTFRCTFLGAC